MGYRINTPKTKRKERTIADLIAETKSIVKTHTNFRNYLLARVFLTANYPAISLYAIYTQNKFGFDTSEAGIFIVINVITSGIGSFLAGWIGDRYGHKIGIMLSFFSYLAAVITALLATNMLSVYTIFVFLGFGLGSFMPSAMNLIYDFAQEGDNKIYMALTDTSLAPFTFLSITIVGGLSGVISTETILTGIGIFLVIGILLLIFRVKDPKHHLDNQPIAHTIS